MKTKSIFIIAIHLLIVSGIYSHPSSSMIYFDDSLYWVYISPINDVNHKAAIMKWNEEEGISIYLVSEFEASDFTLSKGRAEGFDIIESYYDGGEYYVRLLRFSNESKATEILPWFTSRERIGEHGFFVDDFGQIIFCKYPQVYVREANGTFNKWKDFEFDIHSVAYEGSNRFLVRGESKVELIDANGNTIFQWDNLLKENIENLPFRGNIIYDADFENEKLLLAYWGNRSFDIIENGKRHSLKRLTHPYIPHSALINGEEYFLLASTIAPGEYNKIEPALWRISNEDTELIWGEYKRVIHKRQVAK